MPKYVFVTGGVASGQGKGINAASLGRLLKACGLITSRRNGKEMYYKAADTEIVSELHYAIDKIAAITCPD